MNPFRIDARCRIERKTITQDATYGTEIVTWALVGVTWCNVADVLPSRSEGIKTGVVTASQQTRIRMRYRTDIDLTMRIIIDRPTRKTYQIIGGPAEIGRHEMIELMCEVIE